MNIIEQVREAQELANDGNLSTARTQDILAYMLGYLIHEEEERVSNALASLSYSETVLAKALMSRMDGGSAEFVSSVIAGEAGIASATMVNALRKLQAAGVIACRSMGMKGTHIKILSYNLKARLLASQ